MKKITLLLIAAIMFNYSCKKDSKDNSNPGPEVISIESTSRVTASIDGAGYSKIEDNQTVRGGTSADKSLSPLPDSCKANYTSYFSNVDQTVGYFSITKRRLVYQGGSSPSNAVFKGFFNPGTYPYAVIPLNGIIVTYYDAAGKTWSTDMGSKNQTGSVFTISQIKEESQFGQYSIKVMANFNCKLYNDSGEQKTLTNGLFIGYFENI